MEVRTKTQFKQGTIVQLDDKVYQVCSSIDLQWLAGGTGFATTLKPRFELNERFAPKTPSLKFVVKYKKKETTAKRKKK